MFFLYTIKDYFLLLPKDLGENELSTLLKVIEEKYLNKIVENEGLCVFVHDFNVIESIILQSQGDVKIKAEITIIIFRLYENEVFQGKIIDSNKEGIEVSIGFTSIFIPGILLNSPSYYDTEENLWLWKSGEIPIFYYENDKEIRLKGHKSILKKNYDVENINLLNKKNERIYYFIGRCNEDGLGPIQGWEENKFAE